MECLYDDLMIGKHRREHMTYVYICKINTCGSCEEFNGKFLVKNGSVTALEANHMLLIKKARLQSMESSREISGFTQPLTEMSTRVIKIRFLGSKAAAGVYG
jgi:hypothetical protein